MFLTPGTRLGHYDVTSLLGEGGMGQVWQATDTQLNRQVAPKILPDAFAADRIGSPGSRGRRRSSPASTTRTSAPSPPRRADASELPHE